MSFDELELVERINRLLAPYGQEIESCGPGSYAVMKIDAGDMSGQHVLMRLPSYPEPVPVAAFLVASGELREVARQLEAGEPISLPPQG